MRPVLLCVVVAAATAGAQTYPFGIATIAGTPYDPSGDGGPATLAGINPGGVAIRAGNLYLTDGSRVRKITPSGIITTVVGLLDPVVHQPIPGFSGDGGPALGAQINNALSLDFDSAGNLYIADSANSCLRKVTARVVGGVSQPLDGTETITTVAGICTVAGNSNGTGVATGATLNSPRGIAIDPATGALYIADQNNSNVRKVSGAGTITTIAGTGVAGFLDGPAASARFNLPTGVAVDPGTGDVFVADELNYRVRRISGGIVTTFAGTGTPSAAGNLNEGGAAIAANVRPVKVRIASGILYIVDSGVGMIRQVDIATGIITTVAGIGLTPYSGAFPPVGDGGSALAGLLGSGPGGVQDAVFDANQDLFITDGSSRRVRFVAVSASAMIFGQTVAAGNIATVAGPPGIVTFSGDSGPATGARLFGPGSLVFDPGGNLYFTDSGNNRVRRIDPTGKITTIAGNGIAGFLGVPGAATAAEIQPGGLAFNSASLYLTNNFTRVLQETANFITIVTNTIGAAGPPSPDGTAATAALMGAASIIFDTSGNLYVADSSNERIWKVDTSGAVKTVAGGGSVVVDGITVLSATATQARLFGPGSLAFDPSGNLYTVDGSRNRILKVAARSRNQPLDGTEIVTIFAGTGNAGFSGDAGLATAASLNGPGGLVFDAAGNLYFDDGANFRIRKIDTNGMISTVAGTGVAGFSGDGGPATSAQIRGGPLAVDSSGNLYMSDSVNNVVRVLAALAPPSIGKSFQPKKILAGTTSALSFTITNPSSFFSLPGVGFTDSLPANLVVAAPNGLTGSCGGGTITATAGSAIVILSAATLAAGASCTFAVNVTAPDGIYSNTTGAVYSDYGPGNTASDTLFAATPPNLSKVFGEVSINPMSSTKLSFALMNPNRSVTLDGLTFSDTLPAGLVISTPNGLTGSCDSGTIVAPAGNNLITMGGSALAAQASCTFSVNVSSDGTVPGSVTNTTSTVTSNEALPGSAASAALFIGDPFQVRYAANLNVGESYIDITNTGTNGAPPLGPGFGGASGNICVNVYAFDPGEELISCCSCLVTPDQTVNLGVNRDLTVKTLTGVMPTSVTVKLLSTLAGGPGSGGSGTSCTNSAVSPSPAAIANGMEAFGTTLHATPTAGSYGSTETRFVSATLSAGELASINGRCASILGNGSTFGICNSCRAGALGASKF